MASRRLLAALALLALAAVLAPAAGAQDGMDCDAPLAIWQIQGATDVPNCLGERVTTAESIVTAVGNTGFFIQTPPDQSDNDNTTSDGVYAFTSTPPERWGIQVGDVVIVNGRVEEYYALTQLAVTGQRRVEIVSSGADVPEPVDLFTASLDYAEDGTHPMERYEGMLVTAANAAVVASTNQYDEFAISLTGERVFRETGLELDNTPQFAGMGLPVFDLNPELIEVDPPELFMESMEVLVGSRVTVTGGLSYSFEDYVIWPTEVSVEPATFAARPVREALPGEYTIATQNVENLFDPVDDPNKDDSPFSDYAPRDEMEYALRLGKLSEQIRVVLGAPDIVALQEVENSRTLTDLVLRINADDPTIRYASCLLEGSEGRGIDVAYLVRVDRTNIIDCYRMPGTLEATFDGNAILFTRPPLILEAEFVYGEAQSFPITLINLHIKSLGGIETAAVQRQRLLQATMVAEYVQALQTENPDVHLAVLGDFNAFTVSDGLVDVAGIIMGEFDPAMALMAPEADLVEPNLRNLVFRLPEGEQYSYMFNATLQVLDHIMVNTTLDAYVTEVAYGRGNADAPAAWYLEETGALRSSDHDGMVAYIIVPE